MVEDGDVIEIDYIGRIHNTGEIFDLTSEEVAEEEGHNTENMELGPMNVLIGAGHVIPGLEDALRDMENGERRDVEVTAEEAFGERNSDNIATISESDFDEYDVQPRRGLVVEIDGRRGKILSTSSGRVRVDFNHPLAGKDLAYEVEILDVKETPEERADAVIEFYGLAEMDTELEYDDEEQELTVTLPDEVNNPQLKEQLQEELSLIKGVERVTIA